MSTRNGSVQFKTLPACEAGFLVVHMQRSSSTLETKTETNKLKIHIRLKRILVLIRHYNTCTHFSENTFFKQQIDNTPADDGRNET